jgi:hypothetical protein
MTPDTTFAEWLHLRSPSPDWADAAVGSIQSALQRFTDGAIRKLMILGGTQHIKAMTIIRYGAYRRIREEGLRVLLCAASQDIANTYRRRVEQLAPGSVTAAGVGMALAGYGADLIIIDDPIRPYPHVSAGDRARLFDWYASAVATRLLPGGQLMLNQASMDNDDLAGQILASEDGPNWTVVHLPTDASDASS